MLALVHLLLLTAIAAFLSLSLAGVVVSAVLVVLAAVVAELLPLWLRRRLVPELLITAVLAGCWWSIPAGDREALHGLVGLAFAAWVLIPARRGSLRWIAVLATGELLLASQRGDGDQAVLWMVPIAITALAAEAWFAVRLGAFVPVRGRAAIWRSRLRWLVLPSLVAIGVALIAGPPLARQAAGLRERLRQQADRRPGIPGTDGTDPLSVGLSQFLDVGGTTNIEPDSRIAARLLLDRDPEPLGMVYLRALALGDVQLDGGRIRWRPAGLERMVAVPQAARPDPSWVWIYRATGCGDVVLRPDGAGNVAINEMRADRDGNLYRSRLGEAPRIYQADLGLDASAQRAEATEADRYRQVPPMLDALPWERITDPAWIDMGAERAAAAVAQRLASRCRYDLANLPTPPAVAGGALRLFLFGNDQERRGHCQYFATASVLMLRRAGHQARCVAGFASNEYDERGVVFRGLHAHAWIEVVDREGHWRRVDPTPAAARVEVLKKINDEPMGGGGGGEPRINRTVPAPVPLDRESILVGIAPWEWLVAVGVLVSALGAWWLGRRWSRPVPDPRREALRRHTDALLRLAAELGLPVRPSSTLTEVCQALHIHTGVDLSRPLSEHLSARYGEGALPEPWPLEALRTAAVARQTGT